jgi:ribosomal protein S18 acetylase RimI-like enzyme
MTANIRPMIRRDRPSVMELLTAIPEFRPAEVAIAEEVIDSYLFDPVESGYYIAVSETGPAIDGYICYGPTPLTEGTWDIYWMAVAPSHQGNGIGSALLHYAEEKIIKARGRLAIIETSGTPEYEKTRRFHSNQGYEIIGRIPDFYLPGDDKIIYQKRLP